MALLSSTVQKVGVDLYTVETRFLPHRVELTDENGFRLAGGGPARRHRR
jgi:hypothetical protein